MNVHIKEIENKIDYEKARSGPPEDFPVLKPIPGGRYNREDFFALERDNVMRKSWVVAAFRQELPEPGQYKVFDKLGVPIFVVRGRDGVVRAFYNTCRHRGAPVVRSKCGKAEVLRCAYHSWAYSLDGKLVSVPDLRDFPGLEKGEHGLIQVPCTEWNHFIFINLDSNAPPLLEALGPVATELAFLKDANLRVLSKDDYHIRCNWKATVDAFNEVYHVNFIHAGTGGKHFDTHASMNSLFPGGHSRMVTRKNTGAHSAYARGADLWIDSIPKFCRDNVTAWSVFPNASVLVEGTGLTMQFIWPKSVREVDIEQVYMGADWGDEPRPKFWDSYIPLMDNVLREDLDNLEPIQASLDSGAFKAVVVNYQERRIAWFHEQIDRCIGLAKVPEDLRVPQILDRYTEGPVSF